MEDITKSWREEQHCGIIECNSLPFIDLHHTLFLANQTTSPVNFGIWFYRNPKCKTYKYKISFMYLHKYISPLQKPLTKKKILLEKHLSVSQKMKIGLLKLYQKKWLHLYLKFCFSSIPSSKGIAINNLKLVKAISAITHCEINDILISNPERVRN